MIINRNNYEAYFIDYFDGVLDGALTAELFLFLENHQDLKKEFDEFRTVTLEPTEESLDFRDSMKRGEITLHNIVHYLVAYHEGDLSKQEKATLLEFISRHKQFEHDLELFRTARLDADDRVEYPFKKQLKQPVPLIPVGRQQWNYAVAAILIFSLIGGSYFIYTQSQFRTNNSIASTQNIPKDTVHVQTEEDGTQRDATPVKRHVNSPGQNQPAEYRKPALSPQLLTNSSGNNQRHNGSDNRPSVSEKLPLLNLKEAVVNHKNEPVHVVKISDVNPAMAANTSKTLVPAESRDEYISVWEALRNGAENNLKKFAGQQDDVVLASADEKSDLKIADLIGKSIEKVSNEKVQVETSYDDRGKLSSFNFKAGKLSIERTGGY